MEIINELLSDNIGYLNALRNAEVLPKTGSASLMFSTVIKSALLLSGFALLMYIILKTNKEEKVKN